MRLPPQTLAKYLTRLDELITEGAAVPVRPQRVQVGRVLRSGEPRYRDTNNVSWVEFVAWRTKCVTTLDHIVPQRSVHRQVVDAFVSLECEPAKLQFGVAFLTSIRNDLRDGFLDDLAAQVEAEIASDYLLQAERLFAEASEPVGHIPAAVLAGAVLEKELRTLCVQLSPPEPVANANGNPLAMGGLIDALKRRGTFNELTAQQIRAWAAIRNQAAHGHFDQFTKEQVQAMLSGIRDFLARFL
jgi:hypothetical protein